MMSDTKKKIQTKKVDTKELELPETFFIRDIENKVFQGIVLQCLSRIEGIALVEGNFIDNILGRTAVEGIKGISIEQDSKNPAVSVKIEVNICYGYSIPEKAEEIQTICAEEITRLTGLHVSSIHVVFKSVVLSEQLKNSFLSETTFAVPPAQQRGASIEEEYNDEF